ncbi:MAG: hypothetical protein DRN14_05455 [Thermoplasmata archaeon]|nr:MAG: hypothetical protein DRN14_05455 [Thermoplasmata archaeon]
MRRVVFVLVVFVTVAALIMASSANPTKVKQNVNEGQLYDNIMVIPNNVHIFLNRKVNIDEIPDFQLIVKERNHEDALAIAKTFGFDGIKDNREFHEYIAKMGQVMVIVSQYGPRLYYRDDRVALMDVEDYKDKEFYIEMAKKYAKPMMELHPWAKKYDYRYFVKFGIAHLKDLETGEEAVAGVQVMMYPVVDGYMLWPGIGLTLTNGGRLVALSFNVWDVKKAGTLHPIPIKEAIIKMRENRRPFLNANSYFVRKGVSKIDHIVIDRVEVVYDTWFNPSSLAGYNMVQAVPYYRFIGTAFLLDGSTETWDVLVPALPS